MIDHDNYVDMEAHLEYRRRVHQDAVRTLQTRRSALKSLILWADDKALALAPELRPSYPEYLARQRREGKPFSHGAQETWLSIAKVYFTWALAAYPRRYRHITALWIDSLRPAKAKGFNKEREAYSLDDVRAMLAVDDDTLATQRAKSAVAFLFLSGARIGAFVTLPIKAVDLERRRIRQWTDLGVKTKFSKSATTFLFEIPDLLAVVQAWDELVRGELGEDDMWYANITGARTKRVEGTTSQSRYRARSFYAGLRDLCTQARVPYLSPHKLRHGFATHGIDNARTLADLKAISQTLMHSNLSTTDGIYGILRDPEVSSRVARLGGERDGPAGELSRNEILAQIQALMAQLQD